MLSRRAGLSAIAGLSCIIRCPCSVVGSLSVAEKDRMESVIKNCAAALRVAHQVQSLVDTMESQLCILYTPQHVCINCNPLKGHWYWTCDKILITAPCLQLTIIFFLLLLLRINAAHIKEHRVSGGKVGQCSIVGQLSVTYLIFVRVSSDSIYVKNSY